MFRKPKYKLGRRFGAGIHEKCQTPKFVLAEGRRSKIRRFKRPKPLSNYGKQLLEKQKIRFSYGVSEKQFSNYVKDSVKAKGVSASDRLFESLERRLDNVVYRLGVAPTRPAARQIVSHGHFTVNGRRVTIPSYSVKKDDVVAIREGSKNKMVFENLAKKLKEYNTPAWLSFNTSKLEGRIQGVPKNDESFLDFNTVIEFYSR